MTDTKTDVVASQDLAVSPLANDGVALFERLARDPNVDVEKLERLIAMQERILRITAEQAFGIAMADAQKAMRPVAADCTNPQTHSRYASYAALDRDLRPIYTEHGLSLSFNSGVPSSSDSVLVLCKVRHRGGHVEPYQIEMPADGKGAKGGDVMTRTHAAGAGFSYGQRYLLKLIFNIAVDADTDGNAASRNHTAMTRNEALGKFTELPEPMRDSLERGFAELRFSEAQRLQKLNEYLLSKNLVPEDAATQLLEWMKDEYAKRKTGQPRAKKDDNRKATRTAAGSGSTAPATGGSTPAQHPADAPANQSAVAGAPPVVDGEAF